MSRRSKLTSPAGFTLMEIVVALAILGVSLTVTTQLIGGAFNNISRINQYFVASNHAENVMNEMLVSPEIVGPMQSSGVFDDGYRWSAKASEHPLPPDQEELTNIPFVSTLLLLDLQVDVEWDQRDRSHVYTLRSMRVVNTADPGAAGLAAPTLPNQPSLPGRFLSNPANQERQRPGGPAGAGRGRPLPGRPPGN